ncbi:hypothetical protein BN946_scf184893.g1 [Trametes cinnabarina]|uniref:Uncharacterized protein n=1 Tax=Pycnoporus cinnabarinus TaxID=5643 RepID=A0A060SWP6_PYCCI|nr:hypothetical protein BN946_scf184893.g1 [Trametes cinnabarina]
MQAPAQAPAPAPAPALLPTLAQWLSLQTWEDTDEKQGANTSQKSPSMKEEHQYQFFNRVERKANLPFLTEHQGWVDNLLARTDTSELEGVISKAWDALNGGIPPAADNVYPPTIRNAQFKQRTIISGWGGAHKGIKFDIAAIFQTTMSNEVDPEDTVYLLVEVKTESAIRAKLQGLEARIQNSVMPHTHDLSTLTPADKVLVQAVQAELFIHSPLYRYPEPGQPAFTPLYAMRVMASAFYHRAWVMRTQGQRAPTIAPTPTHGWVAMPAVLTSLKRTLSSVWDELRLATCRSLRVQYDNGRVVVYDRSEPALTGHAVCWPLFPLLQWIGYRIFGAVTICVSESLDSGDLMFAWHGTVGAISVVVKTDVWHIDDATEHEVAKEWECLAMALPRNARVASALPIPAYYGLFVGERASIIVMSDCGEPINDFPDQLESLREAQTEALAAMESAGIEVHDMAERNTVFDGTTVRIIDFV